MLTSKNRICRSTTEHWLNVQPTRFSRQAPDQILYTFCVCSRVYGTDVSIIWVDLLCPCFVVLIPWVYHLCFLGVRCVFLTCCAVARNEWLLRCQDLVDETLERAIWTRRRREHEFSGSAYVVFFCGSALAYEGASECCRCWELQVFDLSLNDGAVGFCWVSPLPEVFFTSRRKR